MVGWSYHHDRDLNGFIDGTENPPLMEAMRVALIPLGLAGDGGSILLLQQWEHNAVGWEQLPVATQEGFIGRRKADSAELDPLPPASHVARTDQERLGKVFRRNIAYGTLTRHGTIFAGFSHDQGTLRTMLESMLGADGGPPDELLAVTRQLTGPYCVIPSVDAPAAFDEHLVAMPVVGVEHGE
jgi:putative iron-dependent peroxidase